MSCTLWLIVEDENDAKVIQAILRAKGLDIVVRSKPPTGGTGGISRLAKQLPLLIKTAKTDSSEADCIAVLHDLDQQKQQQYRADYEKVKTICDEEDVELVIAIDELESWLLADEGLCRWLGIRPQNRDSQTKPSDQLRSLLQSKKKLKYQGKGRDEVCEHLDGTGDQKSPSMAEAYKSLKKWVCLNL